MSYIKNWKANEELCAMRMRELLIPATAGWVTARGNLCVQHPVEAVLQELITTGAHKYYRHAIGTPGATRR